MWGASGRGAKTTFLALHPNSFLKAFWQADIRDHIFVPMNFDTAYTRRFENVIKPAIEAISIDNRRLTARRLDLSKSGDSIISEIIDGIAHSAMVLCDGQPRLQDRRVLPERQRNVRSRPCPRPSS